MHDMLHVHLLGSPQITWQGKPVTGFVSNKARALLMHLAVTAPLGRSGHSREALAELLWADTPATKRENLKRALSNLRNLDGITLIEQGQRLVALDLERCWVDVVEFERLANGASSSEVDTLRRAVDLYQADFLAGFNLSLSYEFEAWALGEQTRLKQQLVEALRRLADGYAQRNDFRQAIATLRRLIQVEPWREEAHRRLMRLLFDTGDRSAALAQFYQCRAALKAELDVDPSPQTCELYEQIRAGIDLPKEAANGTHPAATDITPSARGSTLPVPATPLWCEFC